jgi:replicative superfamily II helicase
MANVIRIEDQNALVPTANFSYGKCDFKHFNPVQSRLLETFEGDSNIAVAASTSSGKTICGEMYAAYEVRKRGGKALYIGPMRALAKEKEEDWTSKSHHFSDLNVSICTGDFRVTGARTRELDEADILVMTPEMLASRARNWKSEKSSFLKQIGTVIFDESHLLTVPGRGDHIEVALMKLAQINPDVRVVLLSATMPNVDEICGWVCKLTGRDTYFLESKYRPCPLGVHYETYYDGGRTYDEKEEEKVSTALGIINYYTDDKFLVFVHTKRTGDMMIQSLKRYGHNAEFHNANLEYAKRQKLEQRFKEDKGFRVIVATSTLAWGVNTPARRVIITGVDRGMSPVETYDIDQMCGRAGRPAYDPRGDAYVLVPEGKKNETIARLKIKKPIRSQLLEEVGGHYKTLAFHVVSEIHHGGVETKDEFRDWFHRSLAYHQSPKSHDDIIDKTIESLIKYRATKVEDGKYEVTAIGTVASMFYYSPFDVSDLKNSFQKLFERQREKDDVSVAVALGNVDSNKFGFVNKSEKLEMESFAAQVKQMFGAEAVLDPAIKVAFAYYNLLRGRNDLPAFNGLQTMLRMDLGRTMEVVSALDAMAGKWGRRDFLQVLQTRLIYGVKQECVQLCGIPNVGKMRAEKLHKHGIKDLNDFLGVNEVVLASLLKMGDDKFDETIKAARQMKLEEML